PLSGLEPPEEDELVNRNLPTVVDVALTSKDRIRLMERVCREAPAILFIFTKQIAAWPDHHIGHFDAASLEAHPLNVGNPAGIVVIEVHDPLQCAVRNNAMELIAKRS